MLAACCIEIVSIYVYYEIEFQKFETNVVLMCDIDVIFIGNPYKYSASVPETVEALAGSCVLIPCIFKISKSETGEELRTDGRVAASWLENVSKGNALGKMVYNSSTNTTKGFTRIQIYGNLKFKNCTTVFYNVKEHHAKPYHFRAEISDFKATFLDRPFKLSVIGMTCTSFI